jgi:hypothetical protein
MSNGDPHRMKPSHLLGLRSRVRHLDRGDPDCVAMDPDFAADLQGGAFAAPGAAPRIVQLSPVPGNIYETDRFYYDPAAVYSAGPFGAILALAAAHGHPAVVHDCPDLHEFQVHHPTAVVRPIMEASPAIIARGLALLAQAPPAALAVAPSPLAAPAVAGSFGPLRSGCPVSHAVGGEADPLCWVQPAPLSRVSFSGRRSPYR